MLGKLIKYDLKAVSWLLIPLHILLIAASILARFIITSGAYLRTPNAILIMEVAGYMILFVIVTYVTAFMIVYRFYKNLFSDEGYLTHTLPVTPGQHLLSKTLSGVIWMLIDYFVILASISIVILVPGVLENSQELIAEMDKALEMPSILFWSTTLLLGLLSCVTNVVFYYLCITLGQLFSKHRVIAAIIIYFALSTLAGVLSTIIMIVVGLMPMSMGFHSSLVAYETDVAGNLMRMYIATAIFTLVGTIISYIISYYILNKKVNLE